MSTLTIEDAGRFHEKPSSSTCCCYGLFSKQYVRTCCHCDLFIQQQVCSTLVTIQEQFNNNNYINITLSPQYQYVAKAISPQSYIKPDQYQYQCHIRSQSYITPGQYQYQCQIRDQRPMSVSVSYSWPKLCHIMPISVSVSCSWPKLHHTMSYLCHANTNSRIVRASTFRCDKVHNRIHIMHKYQLSVDSMQKAVKFFGAIKYTIEFTACTSNSSHLSITLWCEKVHNWCEKVHE